MAKLIPTHQKRTLSELHLRIEELKPEYTVVCAFNKYEFESRIYNEKDITILAISVEYFQVEARDGAERLEAYRKLLVDLIEAAA